MTDQHPLAAADGPLVIRLCGPAQAPIRNIDPAHLTTLVMSGTTAMTGRTSARIDDHGIPIDGDAISFVPSSSPAHHALGRPRPGGRALARAAKDAP